MGPLAWKLDVLLEVALLAFMLHRRAWRTWPALVGFLSALCLRDLPLVVFSRNFLNDGLAYFWTYYLGSAIIDAAQILLLTEIGCKLCPIPAITAELRRYIPRVALVIAALTAVFSLAGRIPSGFYPVTVFLFQRLDVAVSVGCAASLLLLCLLAIAFRIQFSHGTRAIVLGFLCETAGTYLLNLAIMVDMSHVQLFTSLKSIQFFVTLLCFAAVVWRSPLALRKSGVWANAA